MEIVFIGDVFFIEFHTMRSLQVDAEPVRHYIAETAPTHERFSLGSMENLEMFLRRFPVRLTAPDHTFLLLA